MADEKQVANEELNEELETEKLNGLLLERRKKLAQLQEEGMDPFDQYKVERTHNSQEIRDNYEELEEWDLLEQTEEESD